MDRGGRKLYALFRVAAPAIAGLLAPASAASAQHHLSVLASLPSQGAGSPWAPLIYATDGNFYGTTTYGTYPQSGAIFRMTPGGTITILHVFNGGMDGGGRDSEVALVQATDGNFYGTTNLGGALDGGTAFRMTPAGGFTVLHTFAGGSADGTNPSSALIQAADGNLYGVSHRGGDFNTGTAFRMALDGTVTVLHSFHGSDGELPSSLVLAAPTATFTGRRGRPARRAAERCSGCPPPAP